MNLVKYTLSVGIVPGCFVKLKSWVTIKILSAYHVKIKELNARNFTEFKGMTHRVAVCEDNNIISMRLCGQPYIWSKTLFKRIYPD